MKYLWLVPIALFFANQSIQMSMTRSRHLSTWVGGGYGMFANLDKPDTRLVRVEVKEGTDWVNYNVRDKELLREIHHYKQHMNDDELKKVLKKIRRNSRALIYAPEAGEFLKLQMIKTVYAE